MKLSVPHMGNVYIPLKALFNRLDLDFVIPPVNNQQALSLGVKYSPEGTCIPFKLTLGNMIQAAEMGADTLLMPGGYGICRLGYYARTQNRILNDMGYDCRIVEVGVSEQKLFGLLKLIKRLANDAPWLKIVSSFRFGLAKLYLLDRMEKLVQKTRPVEKVQGTANQIYARAIKEIDQFQLLLSRFHRLKHVQNQMNAFV